MIRLAEPRPDPDNEIDQLLEHVPADVVRLFWRVYRLELRLLRLCEHADRIIAALKNIYTCKFTQA
jgi:hypothetical protein